MYWTADAGQNTFAARLQRFEHFLAAAKSVGLKTSYPYMELLDKYFHLGGAEEAVGNLEKARDFYELAIERNQAPGLAAAARDRLRERLGANP